MATNIIGQYIIDPLKVHRKVTDEFNDINNRGGYTILKIKKSESLRFDK
jgi:hypothetical protein